jgi:hypothetical protein
VAALPIVDTGVAVVADEEEEEEEEVEVGVGVTAFSPISSLNFVLESLFIISASSFAFCNPSIIADNPTER